MTIKMINVLDEENFNTINDIKEKKQEEKIKMINVLDEVDEIKEEVKKEINLLTPYKIEAKKSHELREYQKDAIAGLRESFKKGIKKMILVVATGGGKTSIASSIIKRNLMNPNYRVLFICDRIELINQTSKRFFEDGIDHGVIQSSHPLENSFKKIQIASVQTLSRRDYSKKFDMVIIDECHTVYTEHKKIAESFTNSIILGLTATPFTKGLGKIYDDIVIGSTTSQLIKLGFLVPYRVFAPSKPDLELIKVNKDDYEKEALDKEVNKPKLIGDIVEHYIKLGNNKTAICFACNVDHSKNIKMAFLKVGIVCEHLDAYTPDEEREEIIKNFKSGKIKVLTSVDILSKGFDYPGVEVIILARPTKSLSLYIQQVGRGLRISKDTGKKECIIIDHSGNTEEHGFCDDDFIMDLNKDEKSKQSLNKSRVEKKEINSVCPSCLMVKKTFKCVNCGFEFLPKSSIVSTDGYLYEYTKDDTGEKKQSRKSVKDNFKDLNQEQKDNLFNQLRNVCLMNNWKPGKAYYLYRDIFGEQPSQFVKLNSSISIDASTLKLVKYITIKQSKSREKYNKQ